MTIKKITYKDFPRTPTQCSIEKCVYKNMGGMCDEPHINAFNGDAECIDMTPRARLYLLQKSRPTAGEADAATPRGKRLSDAEYGRRLAEQMNDTPPHSLP